MVFLDAYDDVSDRVVDLAIIIQAFSSYAKDLNTFERHCAYVGETSLTFDVHPYSYFLSQTKLMRFRSYPHLVGLALSHLWHLDVDLALSFLGRICLIFYCGVGYTKLCHSSCVISL